jgi:hypothetical protein
MPEDLPLAVIHLEAPIHDPARDMVTSDPSLRLDSCFSHIPPLSVSGEFVCPPVVRTAQDYHIRIGKMSPAKRHLHNMSVPLFSWRFAKASTLSKMSPVSTNPHFCLALSIHKRKNSHIADSVDLKIQRRKHDDE